MPLLAAAAAAALHRNVMLNSLPLPLLLAGKAYW
jgi:hypothetical protein